MQKYDLLIIDIVSVMSWDQFLAHLAINVIVPKKISAYRYRMRRRLVFSRRPQYFNEHEQCVKCNVSPLRRAPSTT